MIDIEIRKAAAYKSLQVAIHAGGSQVTNIYRWWFDYAGTLNDILQPSPIVADGEVDEAIKTVIYVMESIDGVGGKTFRMGSPAVFKSALDTLIRAAQHPQREEWLDISSAPTDMTQVILYAYAASTSDHLFCVGYFSKGIWLSADDTEQFYNPTHWLPLETLPSPPKETR